MPSMTPGQMSGQLRPVATVDGGQLQAGAEGAQRGRSFRPWPCRGMAEEKPLDSAEEVTGAQGRGSIVVVDVGIFARVIGIISVIAWMAMLDVCLWLW